MAEPAIPITAADRVLELRQRRHEREMASIYYERIAAKAADFEGSLMTPHFLEMMRSIVTSEQHTFLAANPEFVAPYPPRIDVVGNQVLNINAPIITVREKMEADYQAAEQQRLYDEMLETIRIEDAARARREANMERQHRRLLRRHEHRLPPATSRVWPSLTTGQQYAILKDIDYDVRHGRRA